MKRIGILTSGGDAPGMNAVTRAVVRSALKHEMSVVGFKRGYNGVLMNSRDQNDDYQFLTSRSVSGTIHRGGTFLMTARCKEFHRKEVQQKAIANMRVLGVEGLVCVGGNGTLSGANALDQLGYPVVGVPGTIDNDLEYTDLTIGFDTALNTACESVNRIRDTSDSLERASLVTVMGRDCGDIAIHTALACGAELVMVPELKWSIEDIADRVKWGVMKGKRSMIIIFAEGAVKSLTTDVRKLCDEHEALHTIDTTELSSNEIARMIEELSGQPTRATVLGYTQRGGSPSAADRVLASRLGERALHLLHDDVVGRAVGIRDNKLIDAPIAEACKSRAKMNQELYDLVVELS